MITVLVFPSCNEPGLEIIRSLVGLPNIALHGGSSYPAHQDASASILKHHVTLPWMDAHDFRDAFDTYLVDNNIDLVFPSTEQVVKQFSTWHVNGTTFITQTPEVADIASSKKKTYDSLRGYVPVPEIYESPTAAFPAYAKPDIGAGGRGNMLIKDSSDFDYAKTRGMLITEYLPGDEAVAYSLSDRDGTQLLCLTKTMGRWKGGASQIGTLQDIPELKKHASVIADRLKLTGPWYAQFKMDRFGVYKLSDLNARIGGGSGLTRYAGVNIPLLAVYLFAGMPLHIPRPYIGDVSWVRNLTPYPTVPPVTKVIVNISALLKQPANQINPASIATLFDLRNTGVQLECYCERIPDILTEWNFHRLFHRQHNSFLEAIHSGVNPKDTIFITHDDDEREIINQASEWIRVLDTNSMEALRFDKL